MLPYLDGPSALMLILFFWSFAAATVLPLSSEIPLVLAVRRSSGWVLPVAVATAGNFLGACTTYALARAAVARVVHDESPRFRRARQLIAGYGPPALLLSWVPLIGDALVALAGAARMPLLRFGAWTLVGKAARYIVVAWVAEAR
jgi:membrane protein YqaA with SNARE-associated domain